MKTGNAALIVAAGILLLWVVTSDKLKNLQGAWSTLVNGAAPMQNVTGTAATPVTGTGAAPLALPSVPSSTSLSDLGLPTLAELTYPTMATVNPYNNSAGENTYAANSGVLFG